MKAARRDFDAFTAILKRAARAAEAQHPPKRIVNAVVRDIAELLAANNAAFDTTRFLAAVWGSIPHDEPTLNTLPKGYEDADSRN